MEVIAIVGLSFRLPQGILDEDDLWDVLREGKNLSSEWPSNRLAIDAHHDRGVKQQNKARKYKQFTLVQPNRTGFNTVYSYLPAGRTL